MIADEPLFLDVDDVIEIDTTQLEVYGGATGLRDRGLLESAVAQPQMSFGGHFAMDQRTGKLPPSMTYSLP